MGRLRKNVEYENKLFNDNKYFIKFPGQYAGCWKQKVFKNNNPIHIEIGCGKGRFIIQKALNNPNINYIAIDKFATILYKVLNKTSKLENINNLKIVCQDAWQLNQIFKDDEIEKIYLNFSDPWPKKHHEKNRLTNINFINIYFKILKVSGLIEFKTDNESLYNYTMDVIKNNNLKCIYNTFNIYDDINNNKDNIQTEYEIKWLDKNAKIKKIIIENSQ